MSLMDVFVKIGADTSGLESGISKAKGLAGGLGSAIGTGMKVVGAAVGAATTAVAGFAASSIEVGKSFDASMSQVAATMGVTTDEIGELRDFAMDMGAKTAFSATQAAEALNYMALAGYDADKSMEMLPNVLNLAAAGDMDLARASDMVTDAQTALGLSMSETTDLVDMMATTASKSNTSVSQLGDAILTIGGTAKNLAGGTTELNTMLGVLADNGIKGSEAGTHLRNAILSLSAPTDNAAAALEGLGIETKDSEGNLKSLDLLMGEFSKALDGLGTAERADIISTIFNKTDIAAINALIDTSQERYKELATEIQGAWIASQNFDNGFEGTTLQKMKDNLIAAGISAEDFDTILKKSGGNAGVFVEELADISDLDVNEVLNTMGTNLRMLQTEFDHVQGSAEQMAQTQLDNLAGDVKLWQSALEGAQLLISGALAPTLREFVQFGTDGLTKISDAFKEGGLEGAMDAFGEVLSDGIGMITAKIPDFINAGMELLGAVGQGIIDNLPQIVDAAVQIGVMIANGLISAAPQLASGAMTILESLGKAFTENSGTLMSMGEKVLTMFVNGLRTSIPMALNFAIDLIKNLATYIRENGAELVTTAAELIREFVSGFADAIPDLLSGAADLIVSLVLALTEPEAITQLVMAAADLIMGLANGLLEAIPKLIDAVPQIISNLVSALTAAIPQILMVGIQLIIGLVTGLIQAIPRIVAAIPALILAIVGGLKRGIVQITEVGRDMVAGLWNGIKERWSALVEDFKNLASGLVSGVKDLFGIKSPSKVFADQVGKWIPAGIAVGIKDGLPALDEAMAQMDTKLISDSPVLENLTAPSSSITSISDSVYNLLVTYLPVIADKDTVDVVLEGDADRLFRVMQSQSRRNKQITGQESFA